MALPGRLPRSVFRAGRRPGDSLLDSINSVRANGCGGKRGVSPPLRSNRKLDTVAKRVARGERLKDALKAAGYRALHSSLMSRVGRQG